MFEQLGLDKKTEKVYRALLLLADSPATHIAREAGLKRTSVYHVLENLAGMGLVSTYTHRGVKRYVAENPQKLRSYFEEKMILAGRLIPFLQKEALGNVKKVSIRFFDGQNGLRRMSEESLETKEKKILSIGSSKALLKYMGGKYGFGERRRKSGIFMRSLRFPEDEKSINSRLHQVRFLPETFQFPGYIQIYDDQVNVFVFENLGAGFAIMSSAFSKMMRSLFETLWQTASA